MYPLMLRCRQDLPRPRAGDLRAAVQNAFTAAGIGAGIKSGQQIGITVGSRGIADLAAVLRELAAQVQGAGAEPVAIGAMGSHGGATAAGQQEVLRGLGYTSETLGMPIVVAESWPEAGGGITVNAAALRCDALILVNRVKPHTSFHGLVESGLLKMLAIGLGGPPAAAAVHQSPVGEVSLAIETRARAALQHLSVLGGIALVENGYGETARVVGIPAGEMVEREKELLGDARELLPRLPLRGADVLIVEEMGKCFSGTGMDTNVIGRLRIAGQEEPATPVFHRIVALDLAAGSSGNAYGIGLADFTTRELVAKIDWQATYANAFSTGYLQRAMLPLCFLTEREAVEAAWSSLGLAPSEARVVQIRNTLEVQEIAVSVNLREEAAARLRLDAAGQEMTFDSQGRLKRL